jgi:hypothetical protein
MSKKVTVELSDDAITALRNIGLPSKHGGFYAGFKLEDAKEIGKAFREGTSPAPPNWSLMVKLRENRIDEAEAELIADFVDFVKKHGHKGANRP